MGAWSKMKADPGTEGWHRLTLSASEAVSTDNKIIALLINAIRLEMIAQI